MLKIIRFVKVPNTANPADLRTKGLGGDLIAKFTKSVNSVFSDGRPFMCPTISAINVLSQCHVGCLLPSVRKMFCGKSHVLGNMFSNCCNVLANYFSELCDQVGSDVPITWSPEPYRELVRGGCKHTAHPHLRCIRIVTVRAPVGFTVENQLA